MPKFNLISSANAQTPALQFTKPLPESVAKALHDKVMNEILRENAAARRPKGIVPGTIDFFVHMVVAGTDPLIILPAVISAFIAQSRKSVLWIGLLTGCLVSIFVGFLDYSSHHYDGVIMSRTVSFDLPMKLAATLAAVWIEAFVFREFIAFVRRMVRKPENIPA